MSSDNHTAATDYDPRGSNQDRSREMGEAFATVSALANGRDPPELDEQKAESVGRFLRANSDFYDSVDEAALARRQLADEYGGMGTSHAGERDIQGTLGYPDVDSVTAADYYERYRNQDLAKSIVDAPTSTTWRETPEIHDADADTGSGPGTADVDDEPADQTDFEADVETLLGTDHLQRGLPYYWERSDRNCRLGQYSLLFFGFDDGRDASEPVNEGALNGPEGLRFVRSYRQDEVRSWTLEADAQTGERDPDMPITYEVEVQRPQADGGIRRDTTTIHYSRVIHVTDDPDATRLLSTPALEPVLRRLMDFEKVLGASAEMFWVGADRKFFFSNDTSGSGGQNEITPSGGGGGGTPDYDKLDQHLRQMMHGMKPALYADNMEMETIDGQAVDPSGFIDVLYQSVSAVTGIPKRILTGSERGDLASSQDTANWFGRIRERQTQFAEPVIVRATLDLLIRYGILAEPTDGVYDVNWPSLYQQDEAEEADTRSTNARAVKDIESAAATSTLSREFLYENVLGIDVPDEELAPAFDPPDGPPPVPADDVTPTAVDVADGDQPDGPEAPALDDDADADTGAAALAANAAVEIPATDGGTVDESNTTVLEQFRESITRRVAAENASDD